MGQLGIAQRWSPHFLWRFPGLTLTGPIRESSISCWRWRQSRCCWSRLKASHRETKRHRPLHILSYLVISHHILSYLIVSYHSLSYFIRSYHISTHLTISCHILSCFVISRLLLWESYYICVYAKRCLLLDGQRNWFCFATTTSWVCRRASNRRASWALLSEVWTELNFVGRSEGVVIQNSLTKSEFWVTSSTVSETRQYFLVPSNLWWWWWCFCSWRDQIF